MRRRQLDKLIVSLCSKIVIEIYHPGQGAYSTRAERQVYRRKTGLVKGVLREAHKRVRAAKA